MYFKATKADIGKEAYPIDNSYSQDLETGKIPDIDGAALAGSSQKQPVRVKIVSRPLLMTVPDSMRGLVLRNMVIVKYQDKLYLILNDFNSNLPEPEYFID